MRQPLLLTVGRSALAAGAVLALAACAVGPDFKPADPPALSRVTRQPLPGQIGEGGQVQHLVQGDVAGRWWTLFQSPQIDALMAQALKANPDLQAAEAALRQARETYLAQRGALLPTVDVGAATTREKNSNYLSPVLATNTNLFSLQTAQLNVGYTLDLFGGVRRATEQAAAQAENQRYETEAAYVTLTTNVVVAAIQAAALRDQADAARSLVDLNRQALQVMQKQQAAEANVHAASAGVGIAIANRLPQLTIGGTAGGAAAQWGQLLSNGDNLWSYSASVAQPLFQGGALLHRQRAAEAALDQAKAQYRSAVVGAVQSVADALEALQADARGLDAAATAERRADESLTIARKQLDQGQIAGLALIQVEQTYAQARQALVQAQGARLSDTAALIQALGGDWRQRGQVAQAQ